MIDDVVLSIICNTYNHEKYIRDALESFISQKTNFKFEILIHDDASTDDTASIIKEFEKKYPDIIKPIYQTTNQYSKGINVSLTYQFSRVKGKYIAFCEGDDYWIDPLKLQKQVDALEMHPDIDMCAHAYISSSNGKETEIIQSPKDIVFSTQEVILGGGEFFATNSLVFRANLNNNIPFFRKYYHLDYSLQIHGALRGGVLYLPNCMSVYRVYTEGSWTSRQRLDINKRKYHFNKTINMLNILDEETNYKFTKEISSRIIFENIDHFNDFI